MRYSPDRINNRTDAGMSLVEMMIALLIFGMSLGIVYPAFESLSYTMTEINDKQEMTQRGQRVLDLMAEEIRLAGLYVGPRPQATFCGKINVNSLEHVDGVPYDTLAFFTSELVTTTTKSVPFLMADAAANSGATTVTVNAPDSPECKIKSPPATGQNARSFITFDTLAPTLLVRMYEISGYDTKTISLSTGLQQTISKGSKVYTVVRKKFEVADRSLKFVKWTSTCKETDVDVLVPSWGTGYLNGGIDAFQVEYMLAESTTPVAEITDAEISKVRSVIIWILLRSDYPAKNFLNTATYTLGQAKPFSRRYDDNFRRVLLSRAVEVRNVGY